MSCVGYTHYVFSTYPLLLKKQSVPYKSSLRTPIQCPHEKQMTAEHDRYMRSSCVKVFSRQHAHTQARTHTHTQSKMNPDVLCETRLMSRL